MTTTEESVRNEVSQARELLPGDVLLMLGDGELSKLIAWCGDSIYSHAAIVADSGDLIEAAASGVRRYSLVTRLADTKEYFFVDAFRPLTRGGDPLTDADRAAVLAHAESLLGVPYPIDSLATLGVLVAVRQKWPQHWLARIVVREALDHLVSNDPKHMVCSEVVYRALAECDVLPRGRLAPVVVIAEPTHEPFPHVDWKALWDEVWPLLHPTRQVALAPVGAQVHMRGTLAAPSPDVHVSDAELALRTRAARVQLGLSPSGSVNDNGAVLYEARAEGPPGTPIPNPNPKLVSPLDLATTPSHREIGRLMERS